jgi:2-polyprenyl-3-methyl-5-hydroxy-6-metoxy-1,4-benzoquinol methylase
MSELEEIKEKIIQYVFSEYPDCRSSVSSPIAQECMTHERFAVDCDVLSPLPLCLPPIEIKQQYHINELLAFQGTNYIRACYLALLEREPDEEGAKYYLDALENGWISKTNIIYHIKILPEGKLYNKKIKGLFWQRIICFFERRRPLRVFGRVLSSGPNLRVSIEKQDALINRLNDRFESFANEVILSSTRNMDNFVSIQNHLNQGFSQRMPEIIAEEVSGIEKHFQALLDEKHSELDNLTSSQNDKVAVFGARLDQLFDSVTEMGNGFRRDLKVVRDELDKMSEELKTINEKHLAFEESLKSNIDSRQKKQNIEVQAEDDFYFKFQEEFIKDEAIFEVAESYLPMVQSSLQEMESLDAGFFLDIGCGSGILLEVLEREGIVCKGVEISNMQLELCRSKGLDVEEIDALEYVESLADESLTGVAMIQVAEHLEFEYLRNLFDQINKKMLPGAIMLIETVNPYSLVTLSRFWLDFSHRNPLPPEGLKFLVQYSGFRDCEIQMLREINGNSNLSHSRFSGEPIDDVIYGFSDYLVKGYK